MKLVHEILDRPLNVNLGELCNICFENKLEYRNIIENLENQEILKIYDEEKILKSYEIIYDVFNLTYSDRKIINKVIKDLVEISIVDDNYNRKQNINIELRNYLLDLIRESDYPVEINEDFDMANILKSYGLKISKEYDNFLEKIIDYIDLYNIVLGTEVFYSVNLLQILSVDEIKNLKDFLKYRNLLLINLENVHSKSIVHKQVLIDSDLCRII